MQTAEDRSKLVYRVKVTVDNKDGVLKSGHAGRGGNPVCAADAIALDRVSKRYGASQALSDLSLTVERGEMFGLIGPDGAGKTTTIRTICGLLRPDADRFGSSISIRCRDHRRLTAVGRLPVAAFSLYGDLSIDENIAFFAEIHGLRDYAAARDRLLELTGLAPFRGRLAQQLSGGMKQKLALACTLVHEPALILLDEPTTGVDPVSRREFWKLLAEFLSQRHHDRHGDAVPRRGRALLAGRAPARGPAARARYARHAAQPAAGPVFEVIVARHRRAAALLEKMPGVLGVQMFGERAHVRLDAGGDRRPPPTCRRGSAPKAYPWKTSGRFPHRWRTCSSRGWAKARS